MSIRPKGVRYNTFGFVTPNSGILDGLAHHVLIVACPICIVDLYEMPIFRPNEYFWDHHQIEGEEKWETYARVIRDIIHEGSGMPIGKKDDGSEIEIREKQEYKDLLWPNKARNSKSGDKKNN